MTHTPGLKAALKRGALLAAANWQLVIIQFVAESSLKLLLAVPIVGGAFLVALLLDTSLTELLRGDVREIVTAIISALTASPPRSPRSWRPRCSCCWADPRSRSSSKGAPWRCSPRPSGRRARSRSRRCISRRCAGRRSLRSSRSSPDARRLWRRYVRIGLGLLLVYALTAVAYLAFVFRGYALAANSAILLGLDRGRRAGVERADRLDHADQFLLPDDADGRRHRGRQRAHRRASGA